MTDMYTAQEVAAILGRDGEFVRRRTRAIGGVHRFGNSYAYTADDIERIRRPPTKSQLVRQAIAERGLTYHAPRGSRNALAAEFGVSRELISQIFKELP